MQTEKTTQQKYEELSKYLWWKCKYGLMYKFGMGLHMISSTQLDKALDYYEKHKYKIEKVLTEIDTKYNKRV